MKVTPSSGASKVLMVCTSAMSTRSNCALLEITPASAEIAWIITLAFWP
jgi:hypothetical protein